MTPYTVYRSHFPDGAPVAFAILRARGGHALAAKAAKRRWPGVPLLLERRRSASSSAYRAFCAAKRALPNPAGSLRPAWGTA